MRVALWQAGTTGFMPVFDGLGEAFDDGKKRKRLPIKVQPRFT
jgi:hypothetical protein